MTVRDIFAEGGKMPLPTSTEKLGDKKEPKDFADELIEDEKKAIRFRETKKAMGIKDADDAGKKDAGEAIGVTIVTKSLDIIDKAGQRSADEADKRAKEADRLRVENQTTQQALNKEQLDRIREVAERAEEAAKGKKSDFDIYQEFDGKVQEKVETKIANMPKPEEKRGMSDSVAVELKKLELESARLLHGMTEVAAERERKFQLELVQLKDNREFKMLEYKDKKDFRERGMDGLGGIVRAIGEARKEEAIKQAGGGISRDASDGREVPAGGGQTRSAVLLNIPCGQCGTKIPVPDVDTEQVVECPDCQWQYTVPGKTPA